MTAWKCDGVDVEREETAPAAVPSEEILCLEEEEVEEEEETQEPKERRFLSFFDDENDVISRGDNPRAIEFGINCTPVPENASLGKTSLPGRYHS